MFVAVGLLAVRQHGVLALLVVVGGYSYWFTDSDYLAGYLLHQWAGLMPYLAIMPILFLVVLPVGLLRARTRLGRAYAVFVPATAFCLARLIVPKLVLGQLYTILPGDVVLSLNILLSLVVAWVLYNHISENLPEAQPASLEASPLPG
jgi:hypothetical protein